MTISSGKINVERRVAPDHMKIATLQFSRRARLWRSKEKNHDGHKEPFEFGHIKVAED